MKPSITIFTSTNPEHLGKVYSLKGGALHKETAGFMVAGDYDTVEVDNIHGLAALLEVIGTNQAISNSLVKKGLPLTGAVASKKMLPQTPKAIARTKENFNLDHACRGVLTLDYDPAPDSKVLSRNELWKLLQETIPGLSNAGVVWWCSGSSYIFNGETELKGLSGQRVYILIENLSDVPRAVENLNDRLWLKGYGRIMVSSSGSLLERSLFDSAMAEPARLDFIGGSICAEPLEQRRGKPVILSEGGWLNTLQALPDLTNEEAEKLASLKLDARDAMQAAAEIAKAAWLASRGESIARSLEAVGVERTHASERGNQAARAALGGVLLGDFPLTLESGYTVTISDLLDNREKYHGVCCRDPIEPNYLNGKITAKVYLFGASPNLHSFARGSTNYRLKRQPRRVILQGGRRVETAEEILSKLADEHDLFIYGGELCRHIGKKMDPCRHVSTISLITEARLALYRQGKDGSLTPANLDDATASMIFNNLSSLTLGASNHA
jgi:hypothetical protein